MKLYKDIKICKNCKNMVTGHDFVSQVMAQHPDICSRCKESSLKTAPFLTRLGITLLGKLGITG